MYFVLSVPFVGGSRAERRGAGRQGISISICGDGVEGEGKWRRIGRFGGDASSVIVLRLKHSVSFSFQVFFDGAAV